MNRAMIPLFCSITPSWELMKVEKPHPSSRNPETTFGPFRLIAGRNLLFEGHRELRLGSRALDLLIALVERAGDVVEKEELINYVWPNTFVDEANLRVHVAALRRALGDGEAGSRFISTTPGRGYRFVAKLNSIEG